MNKVLLASLAAFGLVSARVAPSLAAPPNFPAQTDTSSSVNRGGFSDEKAYQAQAQHREAKAAKKSQ
jgi:hypothetical protein